MILDDDLPLIRVVGAATPGLEAAGRLNVAEGIVVILLLVHGVRNVDGDEPLPLDIHLALATVTMAMAVMTPARL